MSTSDPIFGSAPAGMDLSANKTAGDDVAVIVLTIIATSAICGRLWGRSVQQLRLQADDYLIIIALVCFESTGI